MNSTKSKLSFNVWSALLVFGLFGQIAWVIENMYFNVFLYKTVTYNPDAIALMVAASAVTATATTLLVGVLSDRLAKRKIFICAGYVVWGLVIMSFAFVSKGNTAKLFPFADAAAMTIAIVVILDCVMTFFGSTANDAAFNAWVTDVTVPSNRGRAEGLLNALPLLAMLIVFGLFDPLTRAGRWKEFFLIIGGMVIVGGITGIFIIKDQCVASKNKTGYLANIMYGFRPSVIKRNRMLSMILITTAIYCTAMQVFMPYLLIYIEFFLGIANYAIIMSIVLITAAGASIVLGRLVDRYGKHRFLMWAGLVFTAAILSMFIIGRTVRGNIGVTFVTVSICGSIMMACNLLIMLILNASMRDNIPEDKRGHYAGVRMIFFVLIPMIIGPFIGSSIIKFSDATYANEFGEIQYVPNPEIFLGGAIIALFAIVPVLKIISMLKKAIPNEKLLTAWGKTLDINTVLPEYPRPQLIRNSYININGAWEYAICHKNDPFSGYQGTIIVPFSPECQLSGVNRTVTPDDVLYYRRTFTVPQRFIEDVTYLHFGAVDYACSVTINGIAVGSHKGGFLPFSFDVTSALRAGENEITVEVTDPTDTSYISRGKQSLHSGGIWYTPQSGIWQTVWLESAPAVHITNIKITPDIDRSEIKIIPGVAGSPSKLKARIFDKGNLIAESDLAANSETKISVPNAILWSPESPHLYTIEITADQDTVVSYFGMRKFGVQADDKGLMRLFLNNKPYFHNGLLDQGYWSDGMLTPPSDDAMLHDIRKMKELGFNMLRKHIKVEPMRWYYLCDREGMLVWQDMINGGRKYSLMNTAVLPFAGVRFSDGPANYKKFARQDAEGRDEYYRELDTMISILYNCVSLSVWVPFNEGWGQFDANTAVEFIKERDVSRVIDHASGWHDQGGGDCNSLHVYFTKIKIPRDASRAVVLSEFGGYSHRVDGHVFNKERIFGYKVFKNIAAFRSAYTKLFEEQILPAIPSGLSATVYTQLSDVEDEINGILTYDREVCKLDEEETRCLNKRVTAMNR